MRATHPTAWPAHDRRDRYRAGDRRLSRLPASRARTGERDARGLCQRPADVRQIRFAFGRRLAHGRRSGDRLSRLAGEAATGHAAGDTSPQGGCHPRLLPLPVCRGVDRTRRRQPARSATDGTRAARHARRGRRGGAPGRSRSGDWRRHPRPSPAGAAVRLRPARQRGAQPRSGRRRTGEGDAARHRQG